jgi:cobaltochelatase CobS
MGSIEQIIQDLIDLRLAGHRPAMDEDAIRNLVAEAVAGIKPPRIEIKVNEQVKVLDKHTHPMFGQVLSALTVARQSTKWPYLVGPSGTGKSTMAEHLAEALDVPFHTVSMSADKMMHDLIGFVSPVNHSYKEQPLVTLMRNGGVGLIDEIDKAHSSILPGMNGALAQGYITLPTGERMKISDRFYFVAGANTYGTGPDAQYVGSSQIDAATLNRFVRIPIDYDRTYEQARACAVLGERNGTLWCVAIEKMRANRDKHRIDTIISTRDVVGVPHLVATGTITPEQAVEWTIVGNLKEDHRNRLMEGVDLSCLSSVKK